MNNNFIGSDSRLVGRILALLREWGWETGIEKLRTEIEQIEDSGRRAELELFASWMAGEKGAHSEALKQMAEVEQHPELAGWALTIQAFVALRQRKDALAHELLDRASTVCNQDDGLLLATIAHCRGAVYHHEGRPDPALVQLHQALELFGSQHFGTGRVLTTLGAIYASKNNFYAAREFYQQSLTLKERFGDDAGVAVSHGDLGRLYLDWGALDRAEYHFKQDLNIAERIHDKRGEALMYNYLGQVGLARGRFDDAADWLDESILLSQKAGWTVMEGFARKDRAIASIEQGDIEKAEAQAAKAEELFKSLGFKEGLAHVNKARGLLFRARAMFEESHESLRAALKYFDSKGEHTEAARTQFEIARTLRAWGKRRPIVAGALLNALDRAELCRRDAVVRMVEAELKAVDEAELCRQVYQRIRGRDLREDTISLISGVREAATVLFLDVQGSTEYSSKLDPEEVLMMFNQMMADFADVLERHNSWVTAYLGDGFMALVRGTNHATRAVEAALELIEALTEFNRPRKVLRLKSLNVRIGIATGELIIGNVGTYNRMDFTAVGTPANLAARLQSEAEPGSACISRETYSQIPRSRFIFKENSPRTVRPKGLDEQQVWDVEGRAGD